MKTFSEVGKYQSAILASAMDWANGQHTIDAGEVIFLAYSYGVSLPLFFSHFRHSSSPCNVCAGGAHKGILKTLARLEKAIRNKEGNQ